MSSERHDLQKDVGTSHGPPEGGALDHHALSASPMDGTDGGQSRSAPAFRLQTEEGRSGNWRGSPKGDRAAHKAEPEAIAYRARMLAKVGGDQSRTLDFTDSELANFITHAKGLGFDQEDIEAILTVKVRKPKLRCGRLKEVADCLAQKRTVQDINFLDGWDFMRAFREAQAIMLQGGVLAPATYLDPDYMEMHKECFSEMASYLITGDNYERFIVDKLEKYPNLGFKGALYISTVAEIDRILEEAQGDIAKIECSLGIPEGLWQGQQGIWRVDLHEPEEKLLRLPDGSEASANEFWTPGGMTSGGALEAVVGEVPKQEGVTYSARQVIFEDDVENPILKL